LTVGVPLTVPAPLALTMLVARLTVFWPLPLFVTVSWLPNAPRVMMPPKMLATPGEVSRWVVVAPTEPSVHAKAADAPFPAQTD